MPGCLCGHKLLPHYILAGAAGLAATSLSVFAALWAFTCLTRLVLALPAVFSGDGTVTAGAAGVAGAVAVVGAAANETAVTLVNTVAAIRDLIFNMVKTHS